VKNAVLWDVRPYGCCKNRRFRGTYYLCHQGDKNRQTGNVSSNLPPKHAVKKYCISNNRNTMCVVFLCSVLQLLVTANTVPNSLILVDLMMKALCSSETSGLTRAIWHNIPEDGILHSHRRENLKSCVVYCAHHFHGISATYCGIPKSTFWFIAF
jgi:hypothetical protein